MARTRIDKLLVARGFFESRARAQAAVHAGLVQADGAPVRRASEEIDETALLVASAPHPYVSRGGLKLEAALDAFGFDPAERIALDVGASTGGFTDVLLRRGARTVYAVDVGRDQFHKSLRGRPEIRLFEGLDARRLSRVEVPEPVDIIVTDVSFISLGLILPTAFALAGERASFAGLIKPQFEAGPERVKKGIVRDAHVHEEVCTRITRLVEELGWRVKGVIPSPIAGGDGNREFLIGAERL